MRRIESLWEGRTRAERVMSQKLKEAVKQCGTCCKKPGKMKIEH